MRTSLTTRNRAFFPLLLVVAGACSGASTSTPAGNTVVVSVNPPVARLQPSESQQFEAAVTGTTQTAVTWTIGEPAGGSVDTSGNYTAPASEGTFTVVATSVADSSKSGTAVVIVANPGSIDPSGVMPIERATRWNPGIQVDGHLGLPLGPDRIPVRTTVCATVDAAAYGNGTRDATAGIQAAIDACPAGQVVQLSAGDFLINSWYIDINKSIVLRGAGPNATRLLKTGGAATPVIFIGTRYPSVAGSVNLTANAPKGATSIQVTSTSGFTVGQLVIVDEITDNSYVYWGIDSAVAPGGEGRGWFTRYDRPVGQMMEIQAINGNTVTFTTPLHIAFDTAHTAQMARYGVPYGASYAGVEELYLAGGADDNISVDLAKYCWLKHIESYNSMGDSVGMERSFRTVVRDSYIHHTQSPWPGGGGYMLSVGYYTADSLIENNIFMDANKVMVMRASGGGNVIGYNYFDDGFIENYPGWMETGMNASHLAEPHFELFEGNQAFNIDGDDTWGGAVYITYFRNQATGKRRSYSDVDSRRAIGIMYGHYYYSFVGNVLGYPGMSPSPQSAFEYEDTHPWNDNPVGLWRIGYTPTDWGAQPDSRVVSTVHRHANFDYFTNSVRWAAGYSQTLPPSLYLEMKPTFFGASAWPWVDATGTTKVYTLPARARYDAGTPNG